MKARMGPRKKNPTPPWPVLLPPRGAPGSCCCCCQHHYPGLWSPSCLPRALGIAQHTGEENSTPATSLSPFPSEQRSTRTVAPILPWAVAGSVQLGTWIWAGSALTKWEEGNSAARPAPLQAPSPRTLYQLGSPPLGSGRSLSLNNFTGLLGG